MKIRSYTEEQFRNAVSKSFSIRQVLMALGLNNSGGAYLTYRRAIKEWGIDTSHFTGQLWSKGRTIGPKRPIEDYLANICPIQTFQLKNRLIKEGILEKKCSICGITEWNSQEAPLELDHKDGNPLNNALENLRIVCPNCHAQTINHAGKNKRRTPIMIKANTKKQKVCECGVNISSRAVHCKSCSKRASFKILWPSKEELLKRLETSTFIKLANELGVSDNAIRKHLKMVPLPGLEPGRVRTGI